MKRKTLPIVLGSLLLGLFFDFFFYGKTLGVSFFLFVLITLSITIYLSSYYKKPLAKQVFLLMVPALFFSAMLFVRASGFLSFLNVMGVIFLLLLGIDVTIAPDHKLQNYTFRRYIKPFFHLPLEFIKQFLGFGQNLLAKQDNEPEPKRSALPIVRGIFLSIPFIFIFLLLFSSADLVFKDYVGSLFDFSLSPDLISHLLLILFITSLFIGAYALLFMHTKLGDAAVTNTNSKTKLGTTEAYIVLGSVSILFAVFVLIQITYLFGGQGHVTSSGITYSEYARKGFFELITVAIISLGLILSLNTSTTRTSLKQKVTFMWLSGFLIVEVLIIMLSAFKRLSLYEQAYGFTLLRLYSHLFTVWLAVVFILLLIHIFREQRQNQFAFKIFLSLIAFLAILNILNPEAVIARQNIKRYESTGKLDIYYLRSLSQDATPVISTLLNNRNETLQRSVAHQLSTQQRVNSEEPWQSYNIARQRAKRILQANDVQLKANKDYIPTTNELNRE